LPDVKWIAGMFTEEHGMGIPASQVMGMLPSMGAIDKVDGKNVLGNRGAHNALTTLHTRARPRVRLNALSDKYIMGLDDTPSVIRTRPGTWGKNHRPIFETF
jgi:hypothetical protein